MVILAARNTHSMCIDRTSDTESTHHRTRIGHLLCGRKRKKCHCTHYIFFSGIWHYLLNEEVELCMLRTTRVDFFFQTFVKEFNTRVAIYVHGYAC